MVFSSAGGPGGIDLQVSYGIGETWYAPRSIPLLNTPRREMQPHVGPDGTLFFASDRRPGAGLDLYRARRNESGWGVAVPLASLNTPGDESDPCVDSLGRYLLFASRAVGASHSDLLISRRAAAGAAWTTPQPLSAAVNTEASETSPCLSKGGSILYFLRDQRVFRVSLAEVMPRR